VTAYVLNGALRLLRKHEPVVPWMYPDPEGRVRVAMRHLLKDGAAAAALRFDYDVNGEQASPITVLHVWESVRSNRHAYPILRMNDEDIWALAIADLEAAEALLRSDFPNFEEYPAPAQIALLDMAFDLGSIQPHAWPLFVPSVKARDFQAAAVQCIRGKSGAMGPADPKWTGSRNQDTEQLFLQAAEARVRA
jgi:hypothetical protein